MRTTPDTDESIRCSVSGCSCVSFKPESVQLRSCDRCGHSWVVHALEKLHFQAQQPSSCGPVEVALPGLVFDLSSLVLYGTQAIPVRLKILLDRLYSVLTPEQVSHILHTLGWSLGDYVRGYMLQFPSGKVLDRWLTVTTEEELLILKQFLRFGETRPIVELMTLQCLAAVGRLSDPEPNQKSCQSNFDAFIEHNGGALRSTRGDSRLVAGVCRFKKKIPAEHNDTVHQSLLLPFHFPCLVPPTRDPCKVTQCLQKLSANKQSDRLRQERSRQDNECEPTLKIKADPDKPNPAQSIWHQDKEVDLHGGVAKQEYTSSLSPSLNSSLIASSSSRHPSVSSSPQKMSQKIQSSSSYSLNPLPSFSSSFLCPLPTSSSFSSSLHPLPSSLCSLPSLSPAGGRKGRVCCGVCGKSFYDKGTLKIHYNAVHLKIKHRCTVAGCTMVFSSLRSRNRHSANPNPRLHTGGGGGRDAHRNTNTETPTHKDKSARKHDAHPRTSREISGSMWQQDAHTQVRVHALRNGLNLQHGCRDNTPPQADSPPPSPQSLPQNTNQIFSLSGSSYRSNMAPPPPLLPARSAPPPGSPPSLVPLVVPAAVEKTERGRHPRTDHAAPALITPATCNCQPASLDCDAPTGERGGGARHSPPTNQQRWRWESADATPKKKPRKSSMPVKIEREKVEGARNEEEEC
uniref:C2H2-type domain-containing protein n=1 Tax=Dicentrarchus labrax TaxID=13489 RepID=A0A8P4KFD0_DICLA